MESTYNGWKNRQTWNVALWINNDEGCYRAAVDFMRHYKGRSPYRTFVRRHLKGHTPDGVAWNDSELSLADLNAMMRELVN